RRRRREGVRKILNPFAGSRVRLTQANCRQTGRLTQRLECHPHTVEVTGSNPVPPIAEREGTFIIQEMNDECPLFFLPRRPSEPVRQAAQEGKAAGSRFLRASSRSSEKGPAPPRISASRPAI